LLFTPVLLPIQKVMRSAFHDKVVASVRRLSLAGDGLPERMRSTAFVFLGLTAAAGLALVAVFASLNFPLLAPVPLPGSPPESGKIAAGVPLSTRSTKVAIARARNAGAVAPAAAQDEVGSRAPGHGGTGALDISAVPVSGAPAETEAASLAPPEVPPPPPAAPSPEAAPPATSAAATPASVGVSSGSPQTQPGNSTAGAPGAGEEDEGNPEEETESDEEEAVPPSGPSYEPAPAPPGKAKGWEKNGKKGR
jgi:hypothetical protein